MVTELYRFLIDRNRNSNKKKIFALLQIKSLREREQNKGGTKEVHYNLIIITAFALCNLVGRTYLKVTLIIITVLSLCNFVGRTYLMVTLIIITAFAVRNLVGRVYLMVTLIMIIAFSLCNLVGKKKLMPLSWKFCPVL